MLASITPLGERGRNMRWGVTTAFYVVGSVLGGAALGALAGMAGLAWRSLAQPGPVATFAALLVLTACALVADSGVTRLAIPTIHRQVSEAWLGRYRGWVYGLTFGVQLGFGLVTTVTTAAVYLVGALAFLSPSAADAVLVGSTFGLARALPVLLAARVNTPQQLGRLHRRLAASRRRVHGLTLAAETSIGAVAVLALAGHA